MARSKWLILPTPQTAIDINLGCPQTSAWRGGFGAFLLDRDKWATVSAMVQSIKAAVAVPVFCKMRLLDDAADTIEFAQLLEKAGCSVLCVHGRPRGDHRTKNRRKGAADLETIRRVKKVRCWP